MVSTVATHSRIASFTASFSVRLPDVTVLTSAPSSSIRKTLSSWRFVSTSPMKTLHSSPNSAAAVAAATPCWPAPVSAIIRVLPIRLVRSACPTTLFSLCEPVWARSSRLSSTRTPSRSDSRAALGHRCRAAAVVAQQAVELGAERGIGPGVVEPLLQFEAGRHQRFGDETPPELAETAVGTGLGHEVRVAHPSLQS